MASLKSQIAGYAVGSQGLNLSTGKPSGLTIRRGDLIPATAARLPEVLVYVGPEHKWEPVGLRSRGTPVLRVFRLLCECRVSAAIGVAPDVTLEPIETWVETRLFADETFGGLASGIVNWGADQDARQSDQGYAIATLYADIEFVTVRGDPTTRPS